MSHYYVGETPAPPPPLPPRKPSQPTPSTSSPKRWSAMPQKRTGDSYPPLVPTGLLKSPSHDSALQSPPLLPSRNCFPMSPPPLPSKPVGRPPQPLPARAQSFADSHSLMRTAPKIVPNHPQNRDSSGDEYEDIHFLQDAHISETDGLPFLKFVNQNQDHFPVAFEVVLGFSSRSEDVSISEGERFIALFLKRAKVFTIEHENKERYTIPFNTSFHFAPLHNPNNNRKEALSGFIFKTAGDIMISRTLPKIIRAKKSFRGISPQSCVIENELLFVKEVVKNEGERKYLKCIQVSTGKEKQLHEECSADFTTSPHEVRVYLPEILKHFQLPLEALMCMGPDNEEDIPSHLVSTVVNIATTHVEESLIASSIVDDSTGKDFDVPEETESLVLNDIPLNFDINVNVVAVSPINAEKILKLTSQLHKTFTPSNVYPYLANYSRSQLSLIKSVRKGNGLTGITLIETKAIEEMRQAEETSDKLSSESNADIVARIQQLESENKLLKQTLEHITGQPVTIARGRYANLQELQSECTTLRQKLTILENTVLKLSTKGKQEFTDQSLQLEENKKLLSSLNLDQVCQLLAAMDLGGYIPKFQQEMISGDLLLEVSDEILRDDLQMKEIHRMKLRKITSGEKSIMHYLASEDDSYMQMVKP